MPPSDSSSSDSRSPLLRDRSAEERRAPGLLDDALRAAGTRVVLVRGDAAPVRADALATVRPDEVESGDVRAWAFLGRGPVDEALLLAVLADDAEPVLPAGTAWASLRAVGGHLGDDDATVFRTAVALAGWLRDAPFCSACGSHTELRDAGWSRHCPNCGREHFPRTDPAIIVLLEDETGERVLLGANAAWGGGRYSCFAGFAEAGESLEEAVAREVFEEAGVALRAVAYRGSQVWPYPRSLMLGFRARVVDESAARPDGDEIVEVRWFSRADIGAAMRGEGGVQLPGPASIARRLIDDWHGERP